MDSQENTRTKVHWFQFGSLAIAIITMLITANGIDKSNTESKKSRELAEKQFDYSKKQSDTIAKEALIQRNLDKQQFDKEIELADFNNLLVRKQLDLINKQVNLFQKQTWIAEKQYEKVKNEEIAKTLESYLRLSFALDQIDRIHPYYGQDSIRLRNDFSNPFKRVETLKQIQTTLEKEFNNVMVVKNDTIAVYWRNIYKATVSELSFYDEKLEQSTVFVTDKGKLNSKEDISEFKTISFWEYTKYINEKLWTLGILINMRLQNIRTLAIEKTKESLIVRDRYNNDAVLKKLYLERGY
jgi:hypothetical protein